jgi:hypothetical protein
MTGLDRDIISQSMQGYAEVNRITEAERRGRLKQRTKDESLALFSELYRTWEISGKKKSRRVYTWRRDEEFITLRRLLDQIAGSHR